MFNFQYQKAKTLFIVKVFSNKEILFHKLIQIRKTFKIFFQPNPQPINSRLLSQIRVNFQLHANSFLLMTHSSSFSAKIILVTKLFVTVRYFNRKNLKIFHWRGDFESFTSSESFTPEKLLNLIEVHHWAISKTILGNFSIKFGRFGEDLACPKMPSDDAGATFLRIYALLSPKSVLPRSIFYLCNRFHCKKFQPRHNF